MRKCKLLLLLLNISFCFFSPAVFAQSPSVEPLVKLLYKNSTHDTCRLRLLTSISENCNEKDIPLYSVPAIRLADSLLEQNPGIKAKELITRYKSLALITMGYYYSSTGDFKNSRKNYNYSIELSAIIHDTVNMASAYTNLGQSDLDQGNIKQALEFFDRSRKLYALVKDEAGVAFNLNNMSSAYQIQGDAEAAYKYSKQALQIHIRLGNSNEIARAYNNVGAASKLAGRLDEALYYYSKSLKELKELNYEKGVAVVLSNIGMIYQTKGINDSALNYFKKSLVIHRANNDPRGILNTYMFLGTIYQTRFFNMKVKNKKYLHIARAYFDSSFVISKKFGYTEGIRDGERNISQVEFAAGNYRNAFEHYKMFVIYNDSINNEDTRKASIKSQLNYEFDKKEAVIREQQEKERTLAAEKSRFQKIVIISAFVGFLLVMIFAAFIYRSLKITRQQKIIIEEKQREILDSIRYAKRIQESLLPTETYLEKHLKS